MYLDTCILLKLFVQEPDSAFFAEALEGQRVITSELAQSEMYSALLARERSGAIAGQDRRRAWSEFESRVRGGEIRLGPFSSSVLRRAQRILEQCHPGLPLRTLDAVHLATAELSADFPLATTDPRMREAAARLGLPLFPPGESSLTS
jgi:predicted nucleic acid-binding protein